MQIIEKYTFKPAQKVFDFVDAFLHSRQLSMYPPRPIGRLQIFVADDNNELILVKNPSGYLIFFGDVRLPSRLTRQRLYQGTISLRVKGQFYQEELFSVDLAAPENEVAVLNPTTHLQPNYAYPFPKIPPRKAKLNTVNEKTLTILRGHVATETGDKVAGVRLTAVYNNHPFQYNHTDETGQWLFMVPADAIAETPTPITITLHKGTRQETHQQTITLSMGKDIGLKPLVWPED